METRDFRSLSSQEQEDLRRKAVQAILDGKTRQEVASQLGVTRKSVGEWFKKFNQDGPDALLANRRGRPKGGYLTLNESMLIASSLIENFPEDYNMPHLLWTRGAVSHLIRMRIIRRDIDVQFSLWTVSRYLDRWGFIPQKPLQHDFEQNSRSTRRWLRKEYPELLKRAKREGAVVYWGSEMWLRSDRLIGKSYGLKGYSLDEFVEMQPLRGRMVSAISNRGQLCFMMYDKPYCAEVILDFMERLVLIKRKKVYLIVNNHSVHRSQIVIQWLEENHDHIHLISPGSH